VSEARTAEGQQAEAALAAAAVLRLEVGFVHDAPFGHRRLDTGRVGVAARRQATVGEQGEGEGRRRRRRRRHQNRK
jgi:hypothetical protein